MQNPITSLSVYVYIVGYSIIPLLEQLASSSHPRTTSSRSSSISHTARLNMFYRSATSTETNLPAGRAQQRQRQAAICRRNERIVLTL